MIVKENIKINNKKFVKTYSDEGFLILQTSTGQIFSEAYDLVKYPQQYEETDQKIEEYVEGTLF